MKDELREILNDSTLLEVEWEECPYRKEWPRTAKDGGSSFFCEKECKQEPPPCNGTGRIKAEWAKEVNK